MIILIVISEAVILCGVVWWVVRRLETIEQRQTKQVGGDEPNHLFLEAYNEVAEITGDPKIEKRATVVKTPDRIEPPIKRETNVFPGQPSPARRIEG